MTDISRTIVPTEANLEVATNNLDEVIAYAKAARAEVVSAYRDSRPLSLGALHEMLGVVHGSACNFESEFDIEI